MSYSDTITKALLMKHADAMGKDPFAPDYGQGYMKPTSAPPGSIEAKRQEEAAGADAEAEAQAKQQEAEVKQHQKAVGDAQKERDKLVQTQQKMQQDLMAARAEVDAFKARDSVSSPGLSPSYNATQKRMRERVKSLGNATRQYNGALTMNKAADSLVKLAWWKRHYQLPRYRQIAELVKVAETMNPAATVPPQPKRVSGQATIEPRTSTVPKPQTPATTAPTQPSPATQGAPPAGSIKPLSEFQGDDYSTASNQWRQQFGKGALPEQYKQQYSEMLANEQGAAQADSNRGWFSRMGQAAKETLGTAEGRAEVKDQYQQFRQDPHAYMNDNSMVWGDNGFQNALNNKYGEGSIGATGWRSNLAKGGDFVKSIFTRPINQISGGAVQVGAGLDDMADGWSAGRAAGKAYDADKGMYGNRADRDAAIAAAQAPHQNRGPGVGTGLKNVGLGTLGTATNIVGGGAVSGGFKGMLKSPQFWKATGMGTGYGLADGMYGGAGHNTPAGTPPAAAPAAAPAGGGGPQSPMVQQGQQRTPQQTQSIFAGAANNPGFAQNINDYSGWANPNIFPGAMAGMNPRGGNGFMGQLTNVMTGLLGQPDYNSFQQGQTAFRNAGAPQFNSMNNAMSAFGRSQMPNLNMRQQNQPAALSTYGF